MPLSTKILLVILVICMSIMGGFIIYLEYQHKSQLKELQTAITTQKQLQDDIVRSMSTYATKDDLTEFAKSNNINLKAIQDDLDKLNASLNAINVSVVNSSGQTASNIPSTSTSPTTDPTTNNPNSDPYGYFKNTQTLHLDEDFTDTKVPIGDVSFSASKKAPWSVNIQPRQYNLVTVIGKDEDEKVYTYNQFSIKEGDKEYPVKITNSQTKEELPSAKFSFWNPRLYLGIEGGININKLQGESAPTLGIGIISFGQSKKNPDLSVLQIGAGYEMVGKNAQFTLTPISYNIGSKIPMMNNLFVGPTASVDTQGNFSVGLGIRVGL